MNPIGCLLYSLSLKSVVSHSGSLGSCLNSIPFANAQR
jgi:hypothetical protein